MKSCLLALLFFLPTFVAAQAHCELHRFRWECDIAIYPDPSPAAPSLVYCGNSYGYVSKADYDTLVRFHRRSINMVLKIDGEFLESPCIPAHRSSQDLLADGLMTAGGWKK